MKFAHIIFPFVLIDGCLSMVVAEATCAILILVASSKASENFGICQSREV